MIATTRRKVSAAEQEAMVRLHAQRLTIGAIGIRLNRSFSTVRDRLEKAGRIPPHRPRLSEATIQAMAAAYRAGASIAEVAGQFGAGQTTTRAALLYAKVQLRPIGPRRPTGNTAQTSANSRPAR